MNLDAAAAQRLRVGGVDVVGSAGDVVVHGGHRGLVPDADAELVGRAVIERDEEAVRAAAVDRAAALVLRGRTADDEPVVRRGLEVEAGELELRVAGRRGLVLQVLRVGAERAFAGRRVDPAAAGDEAAAVVDDDYVTERRGGRAAVIVGNDERDAVNARRGIRVRRGADAA